ncbi:hypothetical protein HPB49_026384 [Dermacentor silvarum]|nr:hypothetical protein HPB49_026384 [Dermacentor silvarum]
MATPKSLGRLVQQFALSDAYELLHGNTYAWTWRRGASSSRLDRAYVPRCLLGCVRIADVRSLPPSQVYVSDHRPFELALRLPTGISSSRGPWRLDCRVLHDVQSKNGLVRAVKASLVGAEPDDWDELKVQWRHHCSASGRALRARVSQEMAGLVAKMRIAQRSPHPTAVMYAWGRNSWNAISVWCALRRCQLPLGAVGVRRVRTPRCSATQDAQ